MHAQTIHPEYRILVIIDDDHSLASKSCEIMKVEDGRMSNLYSVVFKQVNGGRSKFIFSDKPYRVHDGHEGKRLQVYRNDSLVGALSVNDFKGLGKDTVDLNLNWFNDD